MNGVLPHPLPFLALNDVMQPEFRTLVVRRALNFRRQAGPTVRQQFEAVLRPYAHGAEKEQSFDLQLVVALVDACQHDNQLLRGVLRMWLQSQLPLARRMREFLQSRNLPVINFDELSDGFLGAAPQQEMVNLVGEFHQAHQSFNVHDVALMLCCVGGRLPQTVAQASDVPNLLAQLDEPTTETHTRWHALLRDIRAFSLEAPEWDHALVQAFATAVQTLGEERVRERAAIRAQLHNALAQLRDQSGAELRFFGFYAVNTWSDQHFALHEIAPLADQVQRFHTLLQTHQQQLQAPPAQTRHEHMHQRQQLAALEDEIALAFAQLNSRFPTATPTEQPPESAPTTANAAPQEQPPAVEEQPELLELAVGAPRRMGLFRRRS